MSILRSLCQGLRTLPWVLPFLFLAPIEGEEFTPSRDIQSFEQRQARHVDRFDFRGDYLELEKIDIDARRNYCAELLLTGTYPKLEEVRYIASIGELKAKLTGQFPRLTRIDMVLGTVEMSLDLTGSFAQECDVAIKNRAGSITLIVPKDIGISLHTKVGYKAKISLPDSFKKQGRGWLEKRFTNQQQEVRLRISIESETAQITLKERA